MKVEASKIRRDFSTYLKIAGEGHEVVVTRHGADLAKIVSISKLKNDQQDDIDAFCSQHNSKEDGVNTINRLRAKMRF